MKPTPPAPARALGLRAATLLGLTAMIGGAPIVLAGPAFAAAGPAVLLALLGNGALALLGAFALSELGARFPRSSGPYLFAQRVLGLEAAFAVGWVVLFASLAAAAVFALGFAAFALAAVQALGVLPGAQGDAPTLLLAVMVVAVYGVRAFRKTRSAPALLTVGKVLGLAGMGAAGLVLLGLQPAAFAASLTPFFVGTETTAWVGVMQAMGMLFIAFQGFVVLSANVGELRDVPHTLPRASFITVGVATLLYLPIFMAALSVGRPDGVSLTAFAAATDTMMVADIAQRVFGAWGFWWVALTAIVAMLTAMETQLAAAARLARGMARDGTLPRTLSRTRGNGVPRTATVAVTAFTVLLLVALPNVRTAGVAAGLIFLIVIAVAHALALMVRRRASRESLPYRAPWAPATLYLGGGAAGAVALVNLFTVVPAAVVVLAWLLLGALLYIAAFRTRARALDAELEAANPDVVALRGRRPLVLTPIANPENAESLLSVAHALAPPGVGRVTVLHTLRPPSAAVESLDTATAEAVLHATLENALQQGLAPQTLTTLASDAWAEMARVAETLNCETLLLGLSDLSSDATLTRLDTLLSQVQSDVVVLRAPPGWHLERAQRVLVPFGGRADQERVRARVLGSLARVGDPQVDVVRFLDPDVGEASRARIQRQLERAVEGRDLGRVRCFAEPTANPIAALVERAQAADLLLLGLPKRDAEGHALGRFAAAVVAGAPAHCAVMLVHARA